MSFSLPIGVSIFWPESTEEDLWIGVTQETIGVKRHDSENCSGRFGIGRSATTEYLLEDQEIGLSSIPGLCVSMPDNYNVFVPTI
jgi:hypothetical protein